MGLKKDIYNAFVKSMGDVELTSEQKNGLKKQSELMGEAFIKFLTNQEFRIVNMESDLKVKSISTTKDIDANIKEEVTYVNKDGVDSILKGSIGGVRLPKLNLKSGFGQGGSLSVDGSAIIKQPNWKVDNTSKGNSNKTVVKLFKGEVKNEGWDN